jgi:hypothetical protein
MVYFQTKNPDLGKIWRALERKMLPYCMTIWNILVPFGVIYGRLVCLDQEKSGNPAYERRRDSNEVSSCMYVHLRTVVKNIGTL